MTHRQIKLIENYIRNVVRKTLNEAPIDKYLQLKTPEKVKMAKEWWSSLSFNEMESYFKKYYPLPHPSSWKDIRQNDTSLFALWYEVTNKK